MPTTHPNTPDPASPLERLNLGVASARGAAPSNNAYGPPPPGLCSEGGAEPSTGGILTICFAGDVEASGLYTPPTYCFADEA